MIAREFIPAGAVVWELRSGFDLELNDTQLATLSPAAREQVLFYCDGDYDPAQGIYTLSMDDARHTNHSDTPNTVMADGGRITVAVTDIQSGDEITWDYRSWGLLKPLAGGIELTGNQLSLWWVWALLLAIGVLGGVGDVWVYAWARSDRAFWVMAACLMHVASVVLFGLLLRWDDRAFCAAFMLSSVVHVVIVVASDGLFFGGRLTPTEWAGMALAAVAMVLLEVGRANKPPGDPAPPIETVAARCEGVPTE